MVGLKITRKIMWNTAMWSCIWCCLWTSATCSLVIRPHTHTVPFGKQAVMRCSTNLSYSVDWHFASKHGKEEEIYSSGVISPIYAAEYRIEEGNPEGVYNLVIESVTERHAGKYICIDDEGLGSDTASATLRVDWMENDMPQHDSPVIDTPGEREKYDSDNTKSHDDKSEKHVIPETQSTTISETPIPVYASPIPLIIGLTMGLACAVAIGLLIIILIVVYHKGPCRRSGKLIDENATQSQSILRKQKSTYDHPSV